MLDLVQGFLLQVRNQTALVGPLSKLIYKDEAFPVNLFETKTDLL